MKSRLQAAEVVGLLLLAIPLQGCDVAWLGRSPVGDMTDVSYDGHRSRVQLVNALGEAVALEQFADRFLWTDYAAPWCGPCQAQSRNVVSLERSLEGEVVFLTIMTSSARGYGHPASPETAAGWASRFGLDPRRVLAADLPTMSIPRNLLFSPDGQLLFDKSGLMSVDEMRSTLSRCMKDWKTWKASGKKADWML